MNWLKPKPSEPSAAYFLRSDCGVFQICKAMVPGPVYTASRQGVLLRSGTWAECKAACEAEVERRAA